jgi:hypothetical protein
MQLFSYDLETYVARRSEFAPRIVCGGWSRDGVTAEIGLREEAAAVFYHVLEHEPDTTVINQYIAYDLACELEAAATHPDRIVGAYGAVSRRVRLIWDALAAGRFVGVDICQQLLDVARGEGLITWREKQGYNITNIARWNDIPADEKDDHAWRTYYAQVDGIRPELWPADAREYVLTDALLPHKILTAQMRENQKWIESYGHPVLHQAPENTWSQTTLQLTAAHGVRANPGRVERLARIVRGEIAGYARKLRHEDTCTLTDLRPDQAQVSTGCPGCRRALPTAEEAARGEQGPVAPLLRWKRDKGEWRLSRNTANAAARMRRVCELAGRTVTMTEPSKKFPQGQVQLDEDACVLSGDPVLEAYADYVGADVLRARVLDLEEAVRANLPLHTSFTNVRATGRTSSRKPKPPHCGTQMQNWPRIEGARESLEPRALVWDPYTESWVQGAFLWADFEAAEMHTLAQNCLDEVGYSKLGELLNKHVDPHAWFAGIARLGLTGMSDKEIADLVMGREDAKDMRGWAKPCNFGKPGGMGNEKFVLFSRKQYGVTFSREEAAYYGALWFRCLPEVKDLHALVKRLLGRNETCTVRLKRGGFIGGGKRFTAACNFYFQAPCAAGAKAALNQVARECYADPDSPLFGFRPWNLVHDEICLEGPLYRIHEAGERLREIMEREFNKYTPDYPTGVEVIAGMNWTKQAKPLKDKTTGRLIPGVWVPPELRPADKKKQAWIAYEERKAA